MHDKNIIKAVEQHISQLRAAVCETPDERTVFDWALSLDRHHAHPNQLLFFLRDLLPV
jgi:hypothetical protein